METHFVIGQLVSNYFHVLMIPSNNFITVETQRMDKEDPLPPSDRVVRTKLDKVHELTTTA